MRTNRLRSGGKYIRVSASETGEQFLLLATHLTPEIDCAE